MYFDIFISELQYLPAQFRLFLPFLSCTERKISPNPLPSCWIDFSMDGGAGVGEGWFAVGGEDQGVAIICEAHEIEFMHDG